MLKKESNFKSQLNSFSSTFYKSPHSQIRMPKTQYRFHKAILRPRNTQKNSKSFQKKPLPPPPLIYDGDKIVDYVDLYEKIKFKRYCSPTEESSMSYKSKFSDFVVPEKILHPFRRRWQSNLVDKLMLIEMMDLYESQQNNDQ
jgi:hypothetical protein